MNLGRTDKTSSYLAQPVVYQSFLRSLKFLENPLEHAQGESQARLRQPRAQPSGTQAHEYTSDGKRNLEVSGDSILPTKTTCKGKLTQMVSRIIARPGISVQTPQLFTNEARLSTSLRTVHTFIILLAREYDHLSACHFSSTRARNQGSCRRPTCTTGSR